MTTYDVIGVAFALLTVLAIVDLTIALWNGNRTITRRVFGPAAHGFANATGMLEEGRRGVFLNPIHMIVLRWTVSPLCGLFAAGFAYLLDWMLFLVTEFLSGSGMSLLNPIIVIGIAVLVTLWVFQGDNKQTVEIPIAKGIMLTVFGIPLRVYLINGDYTWVGKDPIIGQQDEVKENFTDPKGQIKLGEIPLQIWNTSEKVKTTEKGERTGDQTLVNIASDGSRVFANLTLTLWQFDPKLTLRSDDPTLDLAERARAAFRTSVSFFTGYDNTVMKTVHGKLMAGEIIVTCYLQKQVGALVAGSVIRDRAGVPMLQTVKKPKLIAVTDEEKEAEKVAIEEAKEKFRELVRAHADPEHQKVVLDKDREIDVEHREVEDALTETAQAIGNEVRRASVSNIILNDTVAKQAESAAGEAFEHLIQVRSANALANYQKVLTDATLDAAKDDPYHELKLVLGAEQDAKHPGDIRVVYVAGVKGEKGDVNLKDAAAVHAAINSGEG